MAKLLTREAGVLIPSWGIACRTFGGRWLPINVNFGM
jgi:hypothetical protein